MSGVSSPAGGRIGDPTNGIPKSALFVGATGLLAQDNPAYTYDFATKYLDVNKALIKTQLDFFGNLNNVTGTVIWNDSSTSGGGTFNQFLFNAPSGAVQVIGGSPSIGVDAFLDIFATFGVSLVGASGQTGGILVESIGGIFPTGAIILTGTNTGTAPGFGEPLFTWIGFGSDGAGSIITNNVFVYKASEDWSMGTPGTTLEFHLSETGSGSDIVPLILEGSGSITFLKTVSSYNGLTLQGSGFPAIVNVDTRTAQGAALSAQAIYSPPGIDGFVEISYSAAVTRVATVSSTLGGATGFQVRYTDPVDGVVKTTNPTTPNISAGNTTATTISGVIAVPCVAGSTVFYLMGYTSAGATTMQYDLNVWVKQLL